MSHTNEKNEPKTNMDRLKEEASACGTGCSCNAGASGRGRWVLGAIVLVIAGVLVVRAAMRNESVSAQPATTDFAMSQSVGAATAVAADSQDAAQDNTPKTSASESALNESVKVASQTVSPAAVDRKSESNPLLCGEWIESLGELNQKATDKDGVFVFLAGNDTVKTRDIVPVIEKSATTLHGSKINMGLFTLKTGSSEYANLAKQVTPPCVLALAKGRGISAVSGDITEVKLMQAFVTASSGGGGCGSSCKPGNCN